MKTEQLNIRIEKKVKRELELTAVLCNKSQSEIATAGIKKELEHQRKLDQRLAGLIEQEAEGVERDG